MSSFADHFSAQAAAYASHRPTYPAPFIASLVAACPARRLAWDVGTGNGQAARLLAEHFTRVVATDPSTEQLRHALSHPRVSYRAGREDESGLADGTADLVTAAQAAHWFDAARFHAEAARVLAPGGVLAVWCYGLPAVDPAVDALLADFYDGRLGPHWPAERRWVDESYRSLPFPFPELPAPVCVMRDRLDARAFLGYVGTWSALERARLAEGADPLADFAHALAALWPDGGERSVAWPLHLRWGRRPA